MDAGYVGISYLRELNTLMRAKESIQRSEENNNTTEQKGERVITTIAVVIAVICFIKWLDNKWTKLALILWIIKNTNTQPTEEEMIECKKFVLEHTLNDLHNTKF